MRWVISSPILQMRGRQPEGPQHGARPVLYRALDQVLRARPQVLQGCTPSRPNLLSSVCTRHIGRPLHVVSEVSRVEEEEVEK